MTDETPRTLFLGNLPYALTQDELVDAFGRFGKIKSVRIITDRYLGRRVPNGVAFIEFDEGASVARAIAEPGPFVMQGREITVRRAKTKVLHRRDTAFVSGIPVGATKTDLLKAFDGLNAVDARIAETNSGARRGFGFVKFANEADQERAVSGRMHVMIRGEEAVVRFAKRGFDERPPMARRGRRGGRRVPRQPEPVRPDSD
jgi:RNA recognition motif-containing protein